jgi:uncharacterized protein YacL (UPF0231 family)
VQQRNQHIQQSENRLKQREISLNQRQDEITRRKNEQENERKRMEQDMANRFTERLMSSTSELEDERIKLEQLQWMYDNAYDPNRSWANTYEATRLFRRLMEDADFKCEFLDRAAIYMGDFLNEKGTRAVWDEMYELIKTEYPYHRELINRWWPNYNDELNNARKWLNKRTDYFYKQLADYYSWGTPTVLTINKTNPSDVTLTFNGITLTSNVFDGKYYAGRTISLSAAANEEGKMVTGWKVTGGINKEVQGSELTLQMPTGYLAITPVIGNATGIEEVANSQRPTANSQLYDLMGNKVATPQAGRIYIQNGKKIVGK